VLWLSAEISTTSPGYPKQPRAKVRYAATNLRGINKELVDGKAPGDKEIIKKASSAQSASNT
jgi:hypothetical protein